MGGRAQVRSDERNPALPERSAYDRRAPHLSGVRTGIAVAPQHTERELNQLCGVRLIGDVYASRDTSYLLITAIERNGLDRVRTVRCAGRIPTELIRWRRGDFGPVDIDINPQHRRINLAENVDGLGYLLAFDGRDDLNSWHRGRRV